MLKLAILNRMEYRIRLEARLYNDIIQVDYKESYYNCTVKGIALVRWAALHCPFARYIFKVCFVDLFLDHRLSA